MESGIVVLLLVIGAVAGGLIVAAWNSEGAHQSHTDYPDDDDETEQRVGHAR